MADYTNPTEAGSIGLMMQDAIKGVRVAQPGTVGSFNAGTQRVVAQPSCKMQTNIDGQRQHHNLPPITNTPIAVPYAQGAGLVMTLPIQSGDPCLLVFADQAIDNVLSQGGAQPPVIVQGQETARPRSHSLTDAMCIPGLITNKSVPNWSTTAIEIRDLERKNYVSVGPDGVEMSDGTATVTIRNGAVTIKAPAGFTLEASKVTIKATEGMDINDISFEEHVHKKVRSGDELSGGPQ